MAARQALAVVEAVPRDIRELSSSARFVAARLCAMLDERRQSAVLAPPVREVLRVVGISLLTLRPGGGCKYIGKIQEKSATR